MEKIAQAVKAHREFFRTGETLDINFRRESLRKFQDALLRYERKFYEAFWADLRKPPFEVFGTEIGMVAKELKHHIKNLGKWAKPARVKSDIINFYSTSRILPEPYGLVMIMSPWNYPLQLTLLPLVGALSAGNCVMLKPANYSKNVSRVIKDMMDEIFPPEYVSVFTGDRSVNMAVLDQRFDMIFFTGSPSLGKIVMSKASQHLTPVVLELGGKSPCIVENDADLKIAAQRISFGKFLNSGQTCIAPDHLFVHCDVKEKLIENIKRCIKDFFGDNPEHADFGRMINEQQFDRVEKLMHSAGNIVHGGRVNRSERYIEPTIIDNIKIDDPIMHEEIFGPLLPVLEFRRLEDVISIINQHEKPLALYFFTSSKKKKDLILFSTSSGGVCINDTIMHVTNPDMPFGGIGNSGMGSYHGKFSFDTFTHYKSVLQKTTLFNITIPYPPYKNKLKYIKPFLS